MAEAIDRFHRVDILFNNAGINIRKQPQELERRRVVEGDGHQPDERLPDGESGLSAL